MPRPLHALATVALLAAASASFAGTVEVTARPPGAHNHAGATTRDAQSNLQTLARYLQRLGQDLLPADQVLKIELLDVDLAGTEIGNRTRIVHGGADFPRIRLRYTLQVPGQAPRTAEETVQDVNYTRGLVSRIRNEPLDYEKRMLRTWFRERFAPASHA